MNVEATPTSQETATTYRLNELYTRFNGQAENDLSIFNAAKPLIQSLSEPHKTTHIEALQSAMSDWFSASSIDKWIRTGKISKKISVDYQSTLLYDAACQITAMYRDSDGRVYIRFEVESDGHYELHPLESQAVKDYLRTLAYPLFEGSVVGRNVINAVVDQLHAREAKDVQLSHRIAEYEGAFYYDRADHEWCAIKITPTSWAEDYEPPVLFIASKLRAEQVEPDRRATIPDLKHLTDLLNIPDKDQELLTLVWLIASFIPNIQIPILYIYGEKRSGKTLLEKALLQIADPTVEDPQHQDVKVLGQPTGWDMAVTQLANRHVAAYDNLYYILSWFANLLSTRITGSIEEKRKQYTDSESYIMQLRGPIILNGIHRHGLEYTDLQDRIIAIRLEQREGSAIVAESTFWKRFAEIWPTALGAIFSTLSRAMAIRSELQQSTPLSRFADFELWGYAIAEAMNEAGLEYSQSDFERAYSENIHNVRYHVLEGHPVAQCLLYLKNSSVTDRWEGTPSKLLQTLNIIAASINVDTELKTWPKNAVWLSRRLDEIKSELREVGITYEVRPSRTGKGADPKRIIGLSFQRRPL